MLVVSTFDVAWIAVFDVQTCVCAAAGGKAVCGHAVHQPGHAGHFHLPPACASALSGLAGCPHSGLLALHFYILVYTLPVYMQDADSCASI